MSTKPHGIQPSQMNLSVDPGVDFGGYCNGTWLEMTGIPDAYPRWGPIMQLRDDALFYLRDLFQQLAATNSAPGSFWPMLAKAVPSHLKPLVLAIARLFPGLFRPVAWDDANGRSYLFVDGGFYHPHPGEFFEDEAAIFSLMNFKYFSRLFNKRPQDHQFKVNVPGSWIFRVLNRPEIRRIQNTAYEAMEEVYQALKREKLVPEGV